VYSNISAGRKGNGGKVTEEVRAEVIRLAGEGTRVCQIARIVGIGHKAVGRILGNLKGR